MNIFKIMMTAVLLILAGRSFAQTNMVKGRLVNDQGEPVQAVVTVKDTKTSITTDINGGFQVNTVSAAATLSFSGVGFIPFDIKVNGRSDLGDLVARTKVTEAQGVTVVANTGYQSLKPNEVNGAVTVVTNRQLNRQVSTNILDRLNGVSSGLAFSTKTKNGQNTLGINIRGLSTINGPMDPLIVLDNFIYEGDINNIDPADIESVTLLKDAAATSIYGARGGNGVIVITSKKARFNQPVKLEFTTNIITTGEPDLFSSTPISAADYINVEQFLYQKGYYASLLSFDYFYHTAFTPAVQVFIKRAAGQVSAADSAAQIDAFKGVDIRNYYRDDLYTRANTQAYALTMTGGGTSNNYLLSLGYNNAIGSLYQPSDKLNIRLQNTFRPVRSLTIGVNALYTKATSASGRPGSITMGGRSVPYLALANSAGEPLSVAQLYSDTYTDTAGAGKLLSWRYYPLSDYQHDRINTVNQELLADISVNYKIFKSLDIDLKFRQEEQSNIATREQDLQSYAARNLINTFSQLNRATGVVKYIVPLGGIQSRYDNHLSASNLRGQLNFRNSWGSHNLVALVGSEIRAVRTTQDNYTYYGYNADPLTSAGVDYVNQYPNFVTGSSQGIPGSPTLGRSVIRYVSVFGNAAYTYRQRYTVSGSMRRDGSNIFGVSTNDRWKPLWSTGLAWQLSKEPFYHAACLPELKLRASIGISGNVDVTRSALPVATYGTDPTTNLPYTRITTINDPSLRWEQSRQVNVGVDFAFVRNIISGSVDWYVKKGTDLYGTTPYDYTTWGGLAEITKNIAAMKGTGLDVAIESRNVNRKIKWYTAWLLNYNVSRTTAYSNTAAQTGTTLIGGGNSITPAVGKPLYSIAAYKWAGLSAAGDPQGYLNGQPSTDYNAIIAEVNSKGLQSANVSYVGSALPVVFGSLINTVSWKRLAVSVNIAYRLGYWFRKPALSYRALFDQGIGNKDFALRWQRPGDEHFTDVPAMVYTNYPQFSSRDAFYGNATVNVLKADNIRMQYIDLTYDIPASKRFLFSSLQLHANVSNLGILWRANDQHLDPDAPAAIPLAKTYAIGIKVIF